MPVPDKLSALILEATSQGFDVTIRMTRRDDGRQGTVNLPTTWARRLGMSDAQIDEIKSR